MNDEREVKRMYCELLQEQLSIDLDKELSPPPVAISFGTHQYNSLKGTITEETPMATYGNFSFIQAPPKSYKSYFVSLMASVYLNSGNKWGGSEFKSYRNGNRLLHFDTEQGAWHCQRSARRVSEMAGTSDGYESYALRTISYKERIDFIDYKIWEKEEDDIGLVIIDGLADLVSDVNDIEQSNACVQKLMEWSAKRGCHIITVIHSNWGSDKPTGHLGSFCEKKAETQIALERNEDTDFINVKCKRSRNFSFKPFDFKINNYGFPEVINLDFPDLPF